MTQSDTTKTILDDPVYQIGLWNLLYTQRKFWLDYVSISKAEELRSEYLTLVSYLEAYGITNCEIIDNYINRAVISFHNMHYSDPKYKFFYFGDQSNIYTHALIANYEDCILHIEEVAFKYGYFFRDLYEYIHAVDILENVVLSKKEKKYIPLPDTFIRQTADVNHDCKFYFRDDSGTQFFTSEVEGFCYFYVNTNDNLKNFIEKIPSTINSAKNVKVTSIGDTEAADMQICIKKKNLSVPMKVIKTWCEYEIQMKRMYQGVIIYSSKDKALDKLFNKLFFAIHKKKYEQTSLSTRAMGLYLWDLVNIEGKTKADAYRFILDHSQYKKHRQDERQLQRDYLLTDKCVQSMSVLSGPTDLISLDKGPLGII